MAWLLVFLALLGLDDRLHPGLRHSGGDDQDDWQTTWSPASAATVSCISALTGHDSLSQVPLSTYGHPFRLVSESLQVTAKLLVLVVVVLPLTA